MEQERLKELIDYLKSNPSIVFNPYPIYDARIFELLNSLGFDKDYLERYEVIKDKDIDDFDILDLRTMYTYIIRGERFSDGFIAYYVDNGILLKLAQKEFALFNEKV